MSIAIPEAIKCGYRLFGKTKNDSNSNKMLSSLDTATVYRNEEAVGKLLKQAMKENNLQRQDIFITSKLGIFNVY